MSNGNAGFCRGYPAAVNFYAIETEEFSIVIDLMNFDWLLGEEMQPSAILVKNIASCR